jgi:AraC family transcriptional regulator
VRDTEVIVLLEGRLPIRRRGDGLLQQCDAGPGTIWLCPKGVREDMIHLYGEVHESIHLFLPSSPLSDVALREMDVDPDKVNLHYDGGFRDPLIEQIARAVRAEMVNPSPVGRILSETLAAALGARILRQHSNLDSAAVALPAARGALDTRRLRRVKDYIEAHLGADLTIETLADEACLSPFHFARAFKAATGMAPHGYLTARRHAKAKSWIVEGLPLAEIAYRLGISSQAYFTKWFKRLGGATPGTYRTGRARQRAVCG